MILWKSLSGIALFSSDEIIFAMPSLIATEDEFSFF